MKFQLQAFDGLVPRVNPRLLADAQAQVAVNCDFREGILKPLKDTSQVAILPDANRISIFPYPDLSSWLSWTTDVDVVRSPISEDQYDRIYYTGSGTPKVRGRVGAVQSEYPLGLPKPTGVPTVAVANKTTVLAALTNREWRYQIEVPTAANPGQAAVTYRLLVDEGVEPDPHVWYSGATPVAATPRVVEIEKNRKYRLTPLPYGYGTGKSFSNVFSAMGPSEFDPSTWRFIMYLTCVDDAGNQIGVVFPTNSHFSGENTLFIGNQRVKVSATQEIVRTTESSGQPYKYLEITLNYDEAELAQWTTDRAYVYTFVTEWGEEGPSSDPSDNIAVSDYQKATVAGLDSANPSGYNVTAKRIYRTVTTAAGTYYQLVAEIPIATASYADELADGDTTDVLPSQNWDAPPSDLAGLVLMPGGYMAGFSGRTVYFSEINQFHAWPPEYAFTVDYDIVGLAVSENTLLVLTEGPPYGCSGSAPDQMTPVLLPVEQACVSKRGIARVGEMVVYPSPDGLVGMQAANGSLLTDQLYTRDQWQALTPTSMIAAAHDNRFYGFASGGNIIIHVDAGRMTLTKTDKAATGFYVNKLADVLYMIVGSNIVSWGTSSDYLTLTWRSKEIMLPSRRNWVVGRVNAGGYSATSPSLKTYANGTLVQTLILTTNVARKLPKVRDEKRWAFEIEANTEIYELLMSTSMAEL